MVPRDQPISYQHDTKRLRCEVLHALCVSVCVSISELLLLLKSGGIFHLHTGSAFYMAHKRNSFWFFVPGGCTPYSFVGHLMIVMHDWRRNTL